MPKKTTRHKLREVRQQKRISLIQAATETRISRNILKAIENGTPSGLSENYEAGMVATYKRYLGLETSASPSHRRKSAGTTRFRRQQLYATADLLKRSLVYLIIVAVLIYAAWQSWQLVRPPYLALTDPPKDLITTDPTIEIKGRTSADASLYLNDQPLLVGADGSFATRIPLRKGLNEINLLSVNSFGRRAELTRSVVFDP